MNMIKIAFYCKIPFKHKAGLLVLLRDVKMFCQYRLLIATNRFQTGSKTFIIDIWTKKRRNEPQLENFLLPLYRDTKSAKRNSEKKLFLIFLPQLPQAKTELGQKIFPPAPYNDMGMKESWNDNKMPLSHYGPEAYL